MELKFVNDQLNPIPIDGPKEDCYAIDLGKNSFADELLPSLGKHFFLSAQPWAKDMDLRETWAFLRSLKELNPTVDFGLLTYNQIWTLNLLSEKFGIEIENTWTSSTLTDWHGRIDGRYSIKDGKLYCDGGQIRTDVYVVFGFTIGEEKPINRTL